MAGKTKWNVDTPHSSAQFAVKHLMISTVKGAFANVSGTVATDDASPAAPLVDVTIDAASIDTRDAKRDAHLKSGDFLETEKYPTLTFKARKAEGPLDGEFKLIGDLTIKDVTRPVTLNVESLGRAKDPWGGERAGYAASTKINRKDFGLTWNVALEAGGVMVGDEVKISLDVQLVKQAVAAPAGV